MSATNTGVSMALPDYLDNRADLGAHRGESQAHTDRVAGQWLARQNHDAVIREANLGLCESSVARMFTSTPVVNMEADPSGKSPHESGAKVDAGKNRLGLVLGMFARALVEVGKIGTFGANKYTPGGWVTVPNGFERYEDAQFRHVMKRHMGEVYDPDSNELHLAHEAWNALAKLDLYIRNKETNAAEQA